jgi:hypothetical protein
VEESGLAHGTFEITLYPSAADLLRAPGAPPAAASYPVTAMHRPPGSLSARRAGGEFAFDPDRLLAAEADPRSYGLIRTRRIICAR